LGRMVASGNTGTHTVKIAGSNGQDITGASVTIATSGKTAGSFAYAALSAPVTLIPGGVYYIISSETAGGDQWYASDTVQTAADASIIAAVWGTGPPDPYISVSGTATSPYGPLDFQYTVGH
ncbi:MAG: hypothetical protein JOZ22_24350, partial [Acidobacteriia bacterium]|nr:hypothetical protein [Terriglobia bacterium]